MDPTKASRTKPGCRLFDRAINSVKNQSSSAKLKMIEETGHVPCFSSINVDSQNLVSMKLMSTPEVQYSSLASNKSKNNGSNMNDFSINTNVLTYSEGKCSADSLSNNSCVDYNLPITQSNFLLDNPEVHCSNLIEDEKGYSSSNNNIFKICSFPQDSFLKSYRLTPMYNGCDDESLDWSSDNALGIANPYENMNFKEKGILPTVQPCAPGSEANDPYLDKISTIDPSDIAEINKVEDMGCIKHELTLGSNSSLREYSVNKFLTNDFACDEPSKSSLLVDYKCANINLPTTRHGSKTKSTGVDLLSYDSNSDNQDSGYMEQNNGFQTEISSGYNIPVNILVSESKSAIDEVKDSRCNFEFNDPFRSKTSLSRSIKVTVEISDSETSNVIDKLSLNCNFSESGSACMLPITIQIAECEGEFAKSPVSFGSGFPKENLGKGTCESYNLPVAILISESGNSSQIQQKPADFNYINVDCAINNPLSLTAKSLTNTREWNMTSPCSENFPSDNRYSGKINTSDEHQDKLFAKKHCDAGYHLPVHVTSADKCMRNFLPKDGGGDVLKNNFMDGFSPKDSRNTKAVSLEEAPTDYSPPIIAPKSKLESFSKSEFEEHSTGLKAYKYNDFSPKSLCESCFLEYSFQFSMFITQFKDRDIDTTECTCTAPLADSKSDSFPEEPSVYYSFPRFSSPESTNFKNFDLTLSPINVPSGSVVCDWNLPELPNDFSLPISSSCCELNPFLYEEDESTNSTVHYGIKSSYSCENYVLGNSKGQNDNDSTSPDREERHKTQDGECLVPGYDLKTLYSSEFGHKFIDSHCHLDFLFQKLRYKGTFLEYKSMNKATFPKSYEGCVAVFCEPDTFINKNDWEKYLEENVWATFGCHPHFSRFYCEKYENAILEALNHPQVRAFGEIGLDYSKNNHCTPEIQHKVFRRQLRICVSKKLPLVLHCRDSHGDTLKVAKEILPKDQKIHLHCFTDTWHWAKEWMEAFPNLCIGFTNHITSNSTKDVCDVVKRMPLNRLLLETDAPYFLPKVVQIRKYSHPGMAIHVAAQIAAIKDIPIEEVLYWARKNTHYVYGI